MQNEEVLYYSNLHPVIANRIDLLQHPHATHGKQRINWYGNSTHRK